ncbi:hypothetical protein ABIE21_001034 [Conyzicola nivalis]|uniref:Uncharacterized protein n=1 Tax=Conyzicola nivalis TaxID=1477021 RepID=A0ABV2QKG5_9MICO
MTAAPAILSIRDETEWRAETLPQIDVKLRSCIYYSDWLADAPSAFDTEHSETARLYETNNGVSPTILGGFHRDQPSESIPMGYTNLQLLEKRAVIFEGALVRLWRSRYKPSIAIEKAGFDAVTEGDRSKHLRLGLDQSIGHAVGQAETLSARMNGAPVIVTRLLSSTFWH